MISSSLNLPPQLRQKAEKFAANQGVSLDQFILWAVAEKVGILSQHFEDSRFPEITYRRGASGFSVPIIKETGLRVQTIQSSIAIYPQSVVAVVLPSDTVRGGGCRGGLLSAKVCGEWLDVPIP